jgi:hypothetical protein
MLQEKYDIQQIAEVIAKVADGGQELINAIPFGKEKISRVIQNYLDKN